MTTLVPTWEKFLVPNLRALENGETKKARSIYVAAADIMSISDDARSEVIRSGEPRYLDRASWAMFHLFRAGAVERPSRGMYRISDLGRTLLHDHPRELTGRDLTGLGGAPTVVADADSGGDPVVAADVDTSLSPIDLVDTAVRQNNSAVAQELLVRLYDNDPEFFEQAVLDLIMGMGYGGAEGTATRTQLSNDGGIDGIVDQDALGLSRIYVQAKRYALDASVGRPEIQEFVGALHGNQANQGVFITTGRFSSGAQAYAASVPTRVVLIDGARMASLMIRFGVGVQVKQTVHIVEVDEDFFE